MGLFLNKTVFIVSILLFLAGSFSASHGAKPEKQPNVILILTDDQGIGDLASLGNPWINTPNLDKFSEMAVRND